MVAKNITAALDIIIFWEGPEVNRSPKEPGGISHYGISLQTYADYCKKNKLPAPTADDIANLTEAQARTFYSNVFLPAIRFNDLPSGVDVRAVDIAVNLGITGGVQLLQMVIGAFPLTSSLSDDQIKTINSYDPKAVILALSTGWISNKHTHTSWFDDGTGHGYGAGWTNRNTNEKQKCLALV
jgi:lysozyme family protein